MPDRQTRNLQHLKEQGFGYSTAIPTIGDMYDGESRYVYINGVLSLYTRQQGELWHVELVRRTVSDTIINADNITIKETNAHKLYVNGPEIDVRRDKDLNTTVSNMGSTVCTIVVSDTQTLTANLAIPTTMGLKILKGGSVVHNGFTLTINGPLEAGSCQIFSGFSPGDVTFGKGSVIETFPQWWGADTTGATSVNTAVQCAVDSLPNGGTVVFSEGSFLFTGATGTQVDLTDNITIEGRGGVIVGGGYTEAYVLFSNKGVVIDETNSLPADGDATWKDVANQDIGITIKNLKITGVCRTAFCFANVANLKILNNTIIGDTGATAADTIYQTIVLSGAIDGALIQGNDIYAGGAVYLLTSNRDVGALTEHQAIKRVRILDNKYVSHTGGCNEAIIVSAYGGFTHDVIISNNEINSALDQTGVHGIVIAHDTSIPNHRTDESFIYDIKILNNTFKTQITTKSFNSQGIIVYDKSSSHYQIYNIIIDNNTISGTTTAGIYCEYAENLDIHDNMILNGNSSVTASCGITTRYCINSKIVNNTIKDFVFTTIVDENIAGIHASHGNNLIITNNIIENIVAASAHACGIYPDTSDNSIISKNTITGGTLEWGIYLAHGVSNNHLVLSDNIINGTNKGIYVGGLFDSLMQGNEIINCTSYGMEAVNDISHVARNQFSNNIITGCGEAVNAWLSDDKITSRNNIIDGIIIPKDVPVATDNEVVCTNNEIVYI